MQRSVVLGVGNVLLRDEGAGVHAVRRLQELLGNRDDVEVIDAGTLSFTLASAFDDAARLIVIDAAQLYSEPGTVQVFLGAEMDCFLGAGRRSVHEVSLIDLLDIARLTTGVPAERALIGVQPEALDWGEHLSAKVDVGVWQAVEHALKLLDQWPQRAAPACSEPLTTVSSQ